jgi:hypothetical protein
MHAIQGEASTFRVFAQQERPSLDVGALALQARRFFDAEIELESPAFAYAPPYEVGALVRVRPTRAGGDGVHRSAAAAESPGAGARRCLGRAADATDRARAESAESRGGFTGLSLLARRCGSVWIVEAESAEDAASLRIAAVLASLLLGPILAPGDLDLFGVRTARTRLANLS